MTTKHCSGCGTTKDEEEFRLISYTRKDGNKSYYRYYLCRGCRKAMRRRNYEIAANKFIVVEEKEPEPYHPHLYPMDQALRHLGVFT